MSTPRHLLLVAAVAAAALPAAAAPASLTLTGGWVRAAPPGAPAAAGYLTVENSGPEPDRLTAIASPDAARVELHRMDMAGGVMRMRQVTGGLEIPAGGKVELRPGGGLHLMLIDPKRRLAAGGRVTAVLTFTRAGRRTISLPVRATPPSPRDMEHGR